jgi:hypothetical protein
MISDSLKEEICGSWRRFSTLNRGISLKIASPSPPVVKYRLMGFEGKIWQDRRENGAHLKGKGRKAKNEKGKIN